MTNKNKLDQDTSFLDVITEILEVPTEGCIVNRWVLTLDEPHQKALELIKSDATNRNITQLFALIKERRGSMPFAVTAFKRHFGGYCPCHKK